MDCIPSQFKSLHIHKFCFLKQILLLSHHLRRGISTLVSLPFFSTRILYAFMIVIMCTAGSAPLLDLITLKYLVKDTNCKALFVEFLPSFFPSCVLPKSKHRPQCSVLKYLQSMFLLKSETSSIIII